MDFEYILVGLVIVFAVWIRDIERKNTEDEEFKERMDKYFGKSDSEIL